MKTDIVIVLYGDTSDLDRCKQSVASNCSDYNLIIEDNNVVNRGFTKANNEGILKGSAPYVWLLNQDATVLPGAQDALIKRFEQCPKAGIVGSMQIDPDDPDFIKHGGTLQAFPYGIHKGGRISSGDCLKAEPQIWVNFASVMLRRDMINQIGLLDENMFLIYSDSDYCFQARYRGWECWYEPESRVRHKLKGSRQPSDWHKKDMEAFMLKWGITGAEGNTFNVGKLFYQLNQPLAVGGVK
jgi:GT2 family glycosyltransferase